MILTWQQIRQVGNYHICARCLECFPTCAPIHTDHEAEVSRATGLHTTRRILHDNCADLYGLD